MAQTNQIIPKFSFPYVEVIINDNTTVLPETGVPEEDTSIKQVYAVLAGKGPDGVWIKKTNKASAIETFGNSNFKKFGQPLMQALNVLEEDNSSVWMMRVMPENSGFSNAVVSAYTKADTAEEVQDAHLRKFRIKFTSKSFENINSDEQLKVAAQSFDGETTNENSVKVYRDAEGFLQKPLYTVRYCGRGNIGDVFSMRINKVPSYEKQYGNAFYSFECISSENGLTNPATYIGMNVTSSKYGDQTVTLINDLLTDAEVDQTPVIINSLEDSVEYVYDEYIAWAKDLHVDLIAEYEKKLDEYQIPEGMLDGTTPVEPEYVEKVKTIKEIEEMIASTDDAALPALDEFDLIYGKKLASDESLPGIYYPKFLTPDVDIHAEDYNAADYTSTENLVDFASAKGIVLANGNNGYFDAPRKEQTLEGETIQWTVEDEVNKCYCDAFSGVYDRKILSHNRMDITAFFDAGYDFSVKKVLAELAVLRDRAPLYLDAGIINTLSMAEAISLKTRFAIFNQRLISIDINNMIVKESSTNKRYQVTISFFNARNFTYNLTVNGFQWPIANRRAVLKGHVKDSLLPVIDDTDTELKQFLYDNRFNYYEAEAENTFRRMCQNTRQSDISDLMEENNIRILYTMKRMIETDIKNTLYDFSSIEDQKIFVEVEEDKFRSWKSNIIESFNITFKTSQFEFSHQIIHAYLDVTFRGLNKQAIAEIDINKRELSNDVLV